MTSFELLFYALLIALVQGQIETNETQSWRRWARIRHHLASGGVLQNVQSQTPANSWSHVRQRIASGAFQSGSAERGREIQAASADSTPETWRDLLATNNVTDLAGFISLLVNRDGQPVRDNDLFSPDETPDGKRVIAGSGELMAASDECSPRNVTVRLDVNITDPGVAYWPECTMIERCGGCTPRPYLECVPRYKEIVVLSVLKARYPFPGAVSMQIDGFAPVRVERHLSCRAACTLTQEECGHHRILIGNRCKCHCKRRSRCANNRLWDEELCQCRCREQVPCCGPEDQEGRGCPLFFNPDSCECTLKEHVGASPNASQAEAVAWLASHRSRQFIFFTPPPYTPTPTPTQSPFPSTTLTSTTPSTTTRARCAHLNCPRHMLKAMTSTGRCLCQRRNRRY